VAIDPSPADRPRVVLVVNGMQDMTELMRIRLEQDGWSVVSASLDELRRGEVDGKALVEAHDPAVIVCDISPPFDIHWRYVEGLRRVGPFNGRPLVVTTPNEPRLREVVPSADPAIEVYGKSDDIEQVCAAVRKAARG
jgi:DNA-binding NarL/FixJ family response regulator